MLIDSTFLSQFSPTLLLSWKVANILLVTKFSIFSQVPYLFATIKFLSTFFLLTLLPSMTSLILQGAYFYLFIYLVIWCLSLFVHSCSVNASIPKWSALGLLFLGLSCLVNNSKASAISVCKWSLHWKSLSWVLVSNVLPAPST